MTANDLRSAYGGALAPTVLLEIMKRLGDLRPEQNAIHTTRDFYDVMPPAVSELGELQKSLYLNAHFEFLAERGWVRLGAPTMAMVQRTIQLTAEGRMFVQPELAQFGREPMLPQVVNYIVNKIEVSAAPQEEKAKTVLKLRQAVASGLTDLVAKVIVEASSKILSGT